MGLLIDSSLLIAIDRGDAEVDDVPEEDDPAVSVVTVSELLHGVYRSRPAQRAERLAAVERILAPFQPIPVTNEVARTHAIVWAELEQAGTPVGDHDLWIGATALTHKLGVATRNPRGFDRIPGLRVVAA